MILEVSKTRAREYRAAVGEIKSRMVGYVMRPANDRVWRDIHRDVVTINEMLYPSPEGDRGGAGDVDLIDGSESTVNATMGETLNARRDHNVLAHRLDALVGFMCRFHHTSRLGDVYRAIGLMDVIEETFLAIESDARDT
jgi:hypothetical protein